MTDNNYQLFHYIIRLDKMDSAFFYFQLEANDGICFYSTLPYEVHTQYRDLELKGSIELKGEMQHILKKCAEKFKIEILLDETIQG